MSVMQASLPSEKKTGRFSVDFCESMQPED